MEFDFKCKPYVRSLTKLMLEFKKKQEIPRYYSDRSRVVGYMLYENNVLDYDISLRLKEFLAGFE